MQENQKPFKGKIGIIGASPLFEQMAAISKASAYDALLPQYKLLQEENESLQKLVRYTEKISHETSVSNADLMAKNDQLKEENERLRALGNEMLGLVKNCGGLFMNEANYPEGTIGFELRKKGVALITKANTILSPSNTDKK